MLLKTDSDETNLIPAHRELFRVEIVVFHRVHTIGGFLRAEHVRRCGGGEFSQMPRGTREGRAGAESGQACIADGKEETK